MAPMYYRGAAAAIVVYDITRAVCSSAAIKCYKHFIDEEFYTTEHIQNAEEMGGGVERTRACGYRNCCDRKQSRSGEPESNFIPRTVFEGI